MFTACAHGEQRPPWATACHCISLHDGLPQRHVRAAQFLRTVLPVRKRGDGRALVEGVELPLPYVRFGGATACIDAHPRPEGVAHGAEIVEIIRIHVKQYGDSGHDP